MLYNSFYSTFHSFPHASNKGKSLQSMLCRDHRFFHPDTPSFICEKDSHTVNLCFFWLHTHTEHIHTHTCWVNTHSVQYGKGITAGPILELAYWQDKLQSTKEVKRQNQSTNQKKVRACPSAWLLCICMCLFSPSHTLLISEWWGDLARACIHM